MKVTTIKGKVIDLDALRQRQGSRLAIGNANMNGYGEILDADGTVIKTQDQITKEYYTKNPKASKPAPVALRSITDEVMTPKQAIAALEEAQKKKSRRKTTDTED